MHEGLSGYSTPWPEEDPEGAHEPTEQRAAKHSDERRHPKKMALRISSTRRLRSQPAVPSETSADEPDDGSVGPKAFHSSFDDD